jgi:hypothetical protein
MKLLKEFVSFDKLEVLTEEVGETKEKVYRLKGPFVEAVTKNKNGRIYPLKLMEREVKRFNEEKISKGRAVGELDHPETPQINLERVSHVIESLVMQENLGMGVARLLDTPMGKIGKSLVKEGIILGMSSRGIGELEGEMVKDGFSMITVDLIFDPSSPSAFVESVVENKEWILKNGNYIEVAAVQKLQKRTTKKSLIKSIGGL